MIRQIKIWTFLFILPVTLQAQVSIDSVLSAIEKNNTSLSALRKTIEADNYKNLTGIYLQNPEVEFDYLWGNNPEIGNRTDFSIRQSFDFPTAYGYRRQIADSRNQQSTLEYQQKRKEILYNARLLCTDIIYANAVKEEYSTRLAHAESLAAAFQIMYEKGEVSILEHNKAQLNLLNLKKEAETNDIERSAYVKQLTALNGGKALELNEKSLHNQSLPSDFDQWYTNAEKNNPELQWIKQEIEVNQHQERLNRALGLPKASAGYMSEKVVGEHFQGIAVGISIPLWENKNTVKYAQARTLALQGFEVDSKLQFYNQLKIQYEKAASLQETVNQYRQAIKLSNNAELLKKALDQGEISLINYLMELSFMYTAIDNLLKSEHELNKSLSLLAHYSN